MHARICGQAHEGMGEGSWVEHGGGERAGEWKGWKGRAWAKEEAQVVDVSFSRWARGLASKSALLVMPLGDQYGV